MSVVLMDGNAKDREIIESTEFWFPGKAPERPAKFDVLLVSSRPHAGSRSSSRPSRGRVRLHEAHKLKDVNCLPPKPSWRLATMALLLTERRFKTTSNSSVIPSSAGETRAGAPGKHIDDDKEVDAEQVMRLRGAQPLCCAA